MCNLNIHEYHGDISIVLAFFYQTTIAITSKLSAHRERKENLFKMQDLNLHFNTDSQQLQ